MKKTILTLLLGSFLLTACSSNQSSQKENNNKTKIENNMKIIHLTKQEFLSKVANFEANPNEWKYLGDKPAIIDFYAEWCGPCKALSPVLEEIANEYDGEIYVYKIDIDKEQDLAAAFNIRSVPTLIFSPLEGQPQMAAGALPKASLKEAVNSVLLKK